VKTLRPQKHAVRDEAHAGFPRRPMRACGGAPCRVVGALLAGLSLGAPLRAEAPPKSTEAIAIEEPIRLDGRLDEPAWARATPATGFVQREPATGQAASEDTDVRVLYTSKVLYVGIDARDRQPELVISKEMQRDEPLWRDDAVDILLDTFDDDRNAYLFETNPNGARTDALITDEGRGFNLQWDGVWDVSARRTPTGWCAEVAIPFSTIRFDPAARAWGFNVLRYIRRRAEQAFWAPILLDADVKRVSLYGGLTGIEGARPGLNLNVKPFAVGTARARATAPSGDPRDLEVGLDLKWGFTRGTSLDLTVNTDFAETEVDALQVNLTRFPLFFPEKRYFFLENAGIFDFGPREPTAADTPVMKLFFSRRIGLGPNGEEVPIEWGARTTGRVGGWSFGLLDVQADAAVVGSTAVPRDNWATARVTRNFGQRSSFGAIATQRYNSGNTNRAYGADLSFKPTLKLTFAGYAAGSDNTRPGGASDWAAGGSAAFSGAEWMAHAGFDRIGEEFDPEAGFLLRRGVDRFVERVAWEPRPALRRVMNLHFEIDSRVYTDLSGGVQSERHRLDFLGLRTDKASEAYLYAADNFERLDVPFAIAPGVVIPPGGYRFDDAGVRYLTHSSRPVSVEGVAEAGGFYDGTHLSSSFTLRLRPNRFLRSESVWQVDDVRLPAGEFTANVLRQRFALALTPRLLTNAYLQYSDLDDLLSLNVRFNWTYRPGSDVYLVFNQRWAGRDSSVRDDWQLQAKLTYLFQR
jgi:hypothetical protein